MAATALFVAVFLIFSSVLGNFLLAKDASAGGMDVEWKVPLQNGFQKMLVVSDGLIIVTDEKGTIQEIDQNGTIRWAFNSTQSDNFVLGVSDFLYFIERGKAQDIVDCLSPNGTLSWRLVSDVPVAELRLGQNGDVYLFEQRNNYSCLVCLTGDGFYKWKFAPDVGLSQILILNDGTVIARNTISVWNYTNNIFGDILKIADNLTAIADDGTILWKKDILVNTDPIVEYLGGPSFGPNATIDLRLTHTNGSMNITEFDRDGRIVPVVQGDQFSRYSCVRGNNTIYVIDGWQIPSSDGNSQPMSRITAWNGITGSLDWQMVQNGSASIYDSINGNGIVFQTNDKISMIGPTGQAVWNVTNYPGDWTILSCNEHGVLLTDDHGTLSRIDAHGDMIWKFDLDSRLEAGSLGQSGEVIVITHDYVISIHKPVLSTTMNYFIVLLAIDLFVTLMSAVGIIDKMWPKAKALVE